MTETERLYALCTGDGYTVQEASFIITAALCSGYFVRRQYRASGSQTQRFLEKLSADKYVRGFTSAGRTIWQFCSGALYRKLGEPSLRVRRVHSLASIRDRLMALDFILEQVDERPAHTAAAKRQLLLDAGVPAEKIPYAMQRGEKHYFADGTPLLQHQDGTLTFGYIDSGHGLMRFRNWLEMYGPAFGALPKVNVCYVCASMEMSRWLRDMFEEAHRRFRPQDFSEPALKKLEYFKARRDWEEGRLNALGVESLMRLRQMRTAHARAEDDELYVNWKLHGQAALGCCEEVAFGIRVLPYGYRGAEWHRSSQPKSGRRGGTVTPQATDPERTDSAGYEAKAG